MRIAHLPVLASLTLVAVSQLVALQEHELYAKQQPHPKQEKQSLVAKIDDDTTKEQQRQDPLVMPALPPQSGVGSGGSGGDGGDGGGNNNIMLSDVLGRDRGINMFAGFTRDFAAITNRFDDVMQNSTVLAPLNSAIEQLPRKPWEDPEDYDRHGANVYEGDDGQERAKRNLRRFVEAHIVPVSPWPENFKVQAVSGGGGDIWWETNGDGVQVIQPGNIEVARVASTVANGQLWIIKGVRNYA